MAFQQFVGLRLSTEAGAVPTTAQINEGELAFNVADQRIFTRFGTAIIDITDRYTRQATDNLLAGKVDKVQGKQLSSEDYTTAEQTKVGHLSVTQATDLDAIRTRVDELDAAVVLVGEWDASGGTFPGGGSAGAGQSWIVSVDGTVDGVQFRAGDRIVALIDNASTTTYADNWLKLDYTDRVSTVHGRTGAVVGQAGDYSADQIDETSGHKILTAAERSKLAGVADEATANASDADLRDRTTHTGTQPLSSISDAGSAASREVGEGSGNVLEVGGLGYGGTMPVATVDLFASRQTQQYYTSSSATNRPTSGNAHVVHLDGPDDHNVVLAFPQDPDDLALYLNAKYAGVDSGWMRGYHNRNIVGIVTDDGAGNPGLDSAVIESGSNANGSYIKFADGTLRTRSVTPSLVTDNDRMLSQTGFWSSEPHTVTFPHEFVGTPTVSLTVQRDEAAHGHWATLGETLSTTQCSVFVFSIAGTGAGYVHVMAEGRWK